MDADATVIGEEDNQQALRDLVRQLRSSVGIIPFIGAGLSAPAGFWGWTDFLLRSAASVGAGKNVEQLTGAGRYEEAAQVLEDGLGDRAFHDLIRQSFGEHRTRPDGLRDVALLPAISSGPVVTTNFDRVLERVFSDATRSLRRNSLALSARRRAIWNAP